MVNRNNYLQSKEYFSFLEEVCQRRPKTLQRYWDYQKDLLIWADEVPFGHIDQIKPPFQTHLLFNRRNDQPPVPETVVKTMGHAKRFLRWAKLTYPAEYRALSLAWIEAWQPPAMPEHAPSHVFVTLEEVKQLVAVPVSSDNLPLLRDQAAAAMLFLSAARDSAFASLPIKAIDLANFQIHQLPHEYSVRTKGGKAATTTLLNIPELLTVVEQWDRLVRAALPPNAMWYTPIISHWGEYTLSANAPGAARNCNVAKRMRRLFAAANLPYKSPHKFRHGHAVYALQRARDMADYKAISQNLMHNDIRITDKTYTPLLGDEIHDRILSLSSAPVGGLPEDSELATLLCRMSKKHLAEAPVYIAKLLAD